MDMLNSAIFCLLETGKLYEEIGKCVAFVNEFEHMLAEILLFSSQNMN